MVASFIRLRPTPVHQSLLSQTHIYALLLDMRHLNHRCQGDSHVSGGFHVPP
jgi:hypothetical protein